MFVDFNEDQKKAIASFGKSSGKLALVNLLKTPQFVDLLCEFCSTFRPSHDGKKWVAARKDLHLIGFELPKGRHSAFAKPEEILIQNFIALIGVWVISGHNNTKIRCDSRFGSGKDLFSYNTRSKAFTMETPEPLIASRFCMFTSLASICSINRRPDVKQQLAAAIDKYSHPMLA